MTSEKVNFLRKEFPEILLDIPVNKNPVFGKMNLHQMIEHMNWAFQLAQGKIKIPSDLEPELVKKMYRFMMSDKPFRENTPNDKLPQEPIPPVTANVTEAIVELKKEIENMIAFYQENKDIRVENPFFGMLNFEEQVHLLHKHARHHLRQFDALPD